MAPVKYFEGGGGKRMGEGLQTFKFGGGRRRRGQVFMKNVTAENVCLAFIFIPLLFGRVTSS